MSTSRFCFLVEQISRLHVPVSYVLLYYLVIGTKLYSAWSVCLDGRRSARTFSRAAFLSADDNFPFGGHFKKSGGRLFTLDCSSNFPEGGLHGLYSGDSEKRLKEETPLQCVRTWPESHTLTVHVHSTRVEPTTSVSDLFGGLHGVGDGRGVRLGVGRRRWRLHNNNYCVTNNNRYADARARRTAR